MQRPENKESEVAKFYNKLAQPDADRRDEVWKSICMYMYTVHVYNVHVRMYAVIHVSALCMTLSYHRYGSFCC